MENKLHQVFHHQNSLKNFGCLIMLFILFLNLTSCKKKTSKSENSYSALKCFSGGINDKVKRVESTPDGGFLYCGVTGHDSSNYDAFLLKVDGKGNQEWYHTYGGPNYDEFNDAIPTSDGGYLVLP